MRHPIALALVLLGCAPHLLADPALPGCGIAALPQEALARLNAARAAGHRCGNHPVPPAPPLRWNYDLQSAAILHSLDMARRTC